MADDQKTKNQSFADRWSPAIARHGYTSIPHLLMFHLKELKLTSPEFRTLCALLSFKWDARNPHPSIDTIARRSKCTARTVRRHIESMEKKAILRRIYKTGAESDYDVSPLIEKLDALAISVLPPGQGRPPSLDETYLGLRTTLSAKENQGIKDPIRKTNNKNGQVKAIGEIIQQRYKKPP